MCSQSETLCRTSPGRKRSIGGDKEGGPFEGWNQYHRLEGCTVGKHAKFSVFKQWSSLVLQAQCLEGFFLRLSTMNKVKLTLAVAFICSVNVEVHRWDGVGSMGSQLHSRIKRTEFPHSMHTGCSFVYLAWCAVCWNWWGKQYCWDGFICDCWGGGDWWTLIVVVVTSWFTL